MSLGGGYKAARWGLTKAQVKAVLNCKGKLDDSSNTLTCELDAGKSVLCVFWKDQFGFAEFSPGFRDGDEDGVKGLLQALSQKYGAGVQHDGLTMPDLNIPLAALDWEDDEMLIRFQMIDPKAWGKSGGSYPASTAKVIYLSYPIRRRMKEANAVDENRVLNTRKMQVEGDL